MSGGDYGRVRHTFWTDVDIKRGITPEQKLLLLYFFSSPHSNMIGLYHCPMEYAARETGLPVEQVRAWVAGPLSRFLSYDEATEEVLVHRAGKHQVGPEIKAIDKRVGSIRKALSETHSRTLVARFRSLYPAWPVFDGSSPEPEAPPKPLRSPSEAIAVAVAVQSSPKQSSPPREAAPPSETRAEPATATAAGDDWKIHRDACTAFAAAAGYGPKEAMIAAGEDRAVWQTPTGDMVPWDDRLRLLKLADAHLKAPGSKARDLRGALTYVRLQQLDPIAAPTAAEFAANRPAPGTEAARILASSRDPEPGAGRVHQAHTPTGPQLVKVDPLESYRAEQEARAAKIATLPDDERDRLRELAKRKAWKQAGDVAYVEGVFTSLALEAVAAREKAGGRLSA